MAFIVAIDGPAGTGKGTITKLVAEELGLINIDTGAMYRCVTLDIINKGVSLDNLYAINEILNKIKIDIKNSDGNLKFFLNGIEVTNDIRTQRVNELVSQVSHIPEVRTNMVNLQRKMAEGKKVIMEGRDIGTNVFPNANVKIYLDASTEERAKRRYKQEQEKGSNITYEEVLKNVVFRDQNDKNSSVAPLKQAKDAILVDTTTLTIPEVKEKVISIIKEALK